MSKDILEIKDFLSIEAKAKPDRIVEAYASVFGNIDKHKDMITEGAFSKTIQERKGKIKTLFNHDFWSLPVGTPQKLEEDSTGLHTVTKMSKSDMGKNVYILIEEKALTTLSIGFYPIKVKYVEEDDENYGRLHRYIQEIKLMEYSFVNFASNELAVVTGVKSVDELERQIKQWHNIYEVGLKSGQPLGKDQAKSILDSLTTLQELVSFSAGHPTEKEDEAKTEEPSNQTHSLLEVLQAEAKRLGKPSVYNELMKFSKTLT